VKILILLGRNFGDAVIQKNNIENLIINNKNVYFWLWCREDFKYILKFNKHPNVKYIHNSFPMGSSHKFNFIDIFKLIINITKLRKLSFSYAIDFTSDFREKLLLALISNKVISILWPNSHPMAKLSRPFNFIFNYKKFIFYKASSTEINIYNTYNLFYKFMANIIGIQFLLDQKIMPYYPKSDKLKIGLSPYASLDCNTWPLENWILLIHKLAESSRFNIFVYCDKSKKDLLSKELNGLNINLISVGIKEFIESFKALHLSVSNDSFATHLACMFGIHNYVIYGANDHNLFNPPYSNKFFNDKTCKLYPCMNKSPCQKDRKVENYNCIKNINHEIVFNKIYNDFF
jgi:ADP-heptose:LPS heptosyltransferase